jgi:hypothetical protein
MGMVGSLSIMTKVTKVIHIRNKKNTHDEVYIGRGSIFGNPYKLKPGAPRGSTLVKYRLYFTNRMNTDTEFRNAVHGLQGKTLVCFCKPHPCHGDIIANYLNKGIKMPTYTCLCEDEYYKNNCSGECDLCSFGHTEEEPCDCDRCTSD